jgi:L-lactate dehydrogenase complex protein LldG
MSKSEILNSISKNRPAPVDLPAPHEIFSKGEKDVLQAFIDQAKSAGSVVENLDSLEKVKVWISQQKKNGKSFIDLSQTPAKEDHSFQPPERVDEIDIVIIMGQLGVAENGAVWIDEHDMQLRKLPFLTSHLVLVLEKEKIVPDMHEAYRQVDLNRTGFGVFIAGPSKTADIEQSLVIGAHGPIEHTILLYSVFS